MSTEAKYDALKKYFGHSSFREGQELIVDRLADGGDALCVMPTGAGKSICYQLPALMSDGVTLVVSPLISLMKDQVNALTQAGIRAAYVNSSLTAAQYYKVLELISRGTYKIVYVAPERLEVEDFVSACASINIPIVAVDEAHCVSQWGQDFRPSYLRIADFIDRLPRRPAVAAFTATATEAVKRDIAAMLRLKAPLEVKTGFDRPNLYFGVKDTRDKDVELLSLLEARREVSGIVYCSTRKNVDAVCELLRRKGFAATRYHAGLSDAERFKNQEDFVYDRCPVMVATNAFGMGIDKSNVSFVVHYNMPKNLESYYQEAGRAGRDGEHADCVLLYSPQDVITAKFLIEHSDDNPELDAETRAGLRSRSLELLKHMTFYCKTDGCLRAFILRYFGERGAPDCGACSNCLSDREEIDMTIEAQKILSCVARTGQRYGVRLICAVLRGMKSDRISELGLDGQSTYGLMASTGEKELMQMIDALVTRGYAEISDGEYPVLRLTARSGEVLYERKPVTAFLTKPSERAAKKRKGAATFDANPELLAALKTLRRELADKSGVPSYVIFTDKTLVDMCAKLPSSPDEFLEVSGVGTEKQKKYGAAFLEVIRKFK